MVANPDPLRGVGVGDSDKGVAGCPQVAAVCAYPELLGAEDVAEDAKHRARQILGHLHGGSPGMGWGGDRHAVGVPAPWMWGTGCHR